MDRENSSGEAFPPPTTTVTSPQIDGTRKRTTSVLEKLRLRGKSTIEKDSTYQETDFGSIAHGEILGLLISLRIPFTQIGSGKNGAMKVLYVIRCTLAPPENAPSNTPMKTWEVTKRFSDFYRLDKTIKECLMKNFASVEGAYGLALLPSRHLLTSDFDEQVIAERRQAFVKYLQSALTASFFFESIQSILATFLECPGSVKGVKYAGGSMKSTTTNGSDGDDDTIPEDKGTAILTQTPHGQAQHGFLHKHAGPSQLFKPFRLLFCVLNFSEGVFRYYRPAHPILLGEMKIKGVYGKVTALEPKQYGIPSNGYGFSLWTPHREIIFYADTNEDRILWIQSFKMLFSNVVPSAATALPIKSPRTPFLPSGSDSFSNYVDPTSPLLDIGDASMGSIVFREESRRLSTLSQDANIEGLTSPIISRERFASASAAAVDDPNQGRQGSITKEGLSTRQKKPSRANSLLESVQEGQRLELQDTDVLEALMRQDRADRRESSSSGTPANILHTFTREAIHAASQRRVRGASETSTGSGHGGAASSRNGNERVLSDASAEGGTGVRSNRSGSLTIGQSSNSSSSRLKPRTSSLTVAPLPSELNISDKPSSSGLSLSPTRKTRPSASSVATLPRFPSNISIMTDATMRPPSYDVESSSPRQRQGAGKSGPTGNRVQQLKDSSWRSKLPPPRFPSQLRITSSGGSSTGGASPSHRLLTRGLSRAKRPFRLFPQMTSTNTMAHSPSSKSVLKDINVENAGLFDLAMWKLKTESLPTRNPHVLLSLMDNPNPWKGRAVHLMTPHQFSACLENVYYDTASLRKSAAFRPKQNDVIVTSVARSGATPIVFALDSLRSGTLVNLEELPARVPWIEGKELSEELLASTKQQLSPVDSARNIRLLKTTMPIRHCLGVAGGNAIASYSPKVVVVLRDPLDLKLSWFRHCRRVYKRLVKKGKSFDERFTVDDFAQVPMPSCNPTFSAAMAPNETYEVYLREVLHILSSGKSHGHMHIVFYEELLSDCENTIRKLAEFFADGGLVDEFLVRTIVDAIQDSPDFPSSLNERSNRLRIGSTGQGHKEFSRHDVELVDHDWDRIVRNHFPEFDSYSTLYERISGTTYPHPRVRPFDEDLAKARRKSSGLNALAVLPPGRKSLRELKVTKFVQKRLNPSSEAIFRTGTSESTKTTKKYIDPDDTEDEEE